MPKRGRRALPHSYWCALRSASFQLGRFRLPAERRPHPSTVLSWRALRRAQHVPSNDWRHLYSQAVKDRVGRYDQLFAPESERSPIVAFPRLARMHPPPAKAERSAGEKFNGTVAPSWVSPVPVLERLHPSAPVSRCAHSPGLAVIVVRGAVAKL